MIETMALAKMRAHGTVWSFAMSDQLDPKEIARFIALKCNWGKTGQGADVSRQKGLHLEGIDAGIEGLRIELQRLLPSLRVGSVEVRGKYKRELTIWADAEELRTVRKTQGEITGGEVPGR